MNIIKKTIHGKESREKMMKGVDQLADVVGSTMGAKGRNVIIDKEHGAPLVINDGVTVANEIFFNDPLMENAAQLIKDAARKTNLLAGDGTTTSTVLARAILKEGWKKVEEGANPVQLRKELDKACDRILNNLKPELVTQKEQAINIAKVSVQDEELGEKIGSLLYDLGANGAVSIKNSIERGVFIEKEAGMRLEGALQGGVLENQDRWETKLSKPKILILKDSPEDHEFETKWVPLMRQFVDGHTDNNGNLVITKVHVPNLLIVAEKLSRRFIMAMNQNKDTIKWVWFRPSTAGKNMKEIYEDLRSITGGELIHEESGVYLNKIQITDLGKADEATITRHELVITVEDKQLNSDRFLDRVTAVKGQMNNAEDQIEQEQIRERYANLTGGVATIKVSSATEQDTMELKLRIEDAINATRSAMQEGYVAGGGVALLDAAEFNETLGEKILKEACKAPITQILKNAGYEDIEKTLKKLKKGEGINVLTDQVLDLKENGIIDPMKVVRLSLLNAVSVSGLLLTSEYVVISDGESDVDAMRRILTGK